MAGVLLDPFAALAYRESRQRTPPTPWEPSCEARGASIDSPGYWMRSGHTPTMHFQTLGVRSRWRMLLMT